MRWERRTYTREELDLARRIVAKVAGRAA